MNQIDRFAATSPLVSPISSARRTGGARPRRAFTPLELVRMALDFEEVSALHVPIEELASARDAAQLVELLRAQAKARVSADDDGDGPPRPPSRDAFDHVVRYTLAAYLGVDAETLTPSQSLRDDLDMRTVDIAIVILRLEDIARAPFPHATARLADTIGELTELFAAVAMARR